ncbi:transducin beta-like protein 3 [Leptopilina boulardi]|uniref:transducin beta-like protein 3 n=1 Tax=Leptopilina boulardi TaxID=63433 RepID=UPI0021F57EEF|nr:transducin beta-like protein 3 [Leptopilina boulardi]
MGENLLKEAFEVESEHGAFYTGGNIQWSKDGEHLFCQNQGQVSVLSVNKGLIKSVIGKPEKEEDEEDPINCFALSTDNLSLITQHKSSLFKLWSWEETKLKKMWKSIHQGPVTQISFFDGDILMASGGSDGSVRLWNIEHQSCTHNLKGIQGVISVLEFHPDSEKELLFAAGDDTKIHGWNIKTGQKKLLLNGHFSKITSISFHEDGIHMLSSGRDKVLVLWDILKGTSLKVLPVYEGIEGAFIIPSEAVLPNSLKNKSSEIYAACAGEKGVIKIWKMKSGREVYTQENSLVHPAKEAGGLSITHLLYNAKSNSAAVVSADHNIIIHSMETFDCKKQLVGYSAEILDLVYVGEGDTHLAVASNSCDIKLYELETMNCQLLGGHTDFVMALTTTHINRHLFASSSKDNSVRLWLLDRESLQASCIGVGVRHTESVASIALSQASTKFFASVSKDYCLKIWDVPEKLVTGDAVTLSAIFSVKAHDAEINCVSVSPNDKFIATAALDKTAKLWDASNLQLLGVFRGHRRSVWCVRFSPIDQVLLTSSADCTMKIWSLTELNCLKTFEGHEASVIRTEFLSRGMQIMSSSGDGLVKLWCVKTSECVSTLEKHESAVWALKVNKIETHVATGGSDSKLIIWRDVSQENKAKLIAEKEELILQEQKLSNLLKADLLTEALNLSLKLEKPFQSLKIVEGIIKKSEENLVNTIRELKPSRQESLLKCAVIWNTNSRNSQAAQLVINALMNEISGEYLQTIGYNSSLESLIPYSERHFKRVTRLLQDLHLLNYTVHRMKPHMTPMNID